MEKKESVISGEELMKLREKQLPEAKEELWNFLDNMSKSGKYHITVIAEVLGDAANEMSVGREGGYMRGQIDLIEQLRNGLNKIESRLLG